ncbi:MAG TPA: YkgJ family cysteine cluster protein [Gemmataceae bacterium]|jgi:Fe-S-cluster containining protein|nr:YkgJ family cysteine cluster protein [Gemmataceae bacterium]
MSRRPPGQGPKKQAPQARSGAELDARRDQRVFTAAQFRQVRTSLQVIEVTQHADALAEQAVRATREEMPPRTPLACREGCAWCCYKPVGTAAPEVLRIVAYLRDTLSPEQWGDLCARVRSGAEQRRQLGPARARRAALPCPLLVENRCSAYPVRPLTCRGYNSSDAKRCERALGADSGVEVPIYWPQQRLTAFVLDGLRAGLEESRLDAGLLDLTAAMEIALETPDAQERWLEGVGVFRPARLD